MSLRDPSYQSDIELGLADTEYIGALKFEREQLRKERRGIPTRRATSGARQRRAALNARLARIEELLKK